MFPGFGHYLLNQYIRGTLLTLSELITNTLAHINEAIVFSFCGQFEMAKAIIEPRWAFGYIMIYFYAIWDSYRSTLTQNKLCQLAEFDNSPFPLINLHPLEIQYLEQKNPITAAVYSFFFPGLGQLYNHRWGLAFYAIFFWWFYLTLSRAHESMLNLFLGNIQESIAMLDPHWLLFMPSVIGGSVYHAYMTALEHNRLYRLEQRQYLLTRYRFSKVHIFP
jgi:TM2 domain-containing membrane protein YozV